MTVLVIEAPEPLVSLQDAKRHLRDPADEDDLIEGYIAAASAWIDGPAGWLGRSIGEQTLEFRADDFAACERLPYGPVSAVTSVRYLDSAGADQLADPAIYDLAACGLRLKSGRSWPVTGGQCEGVRVVYEAGEAEPPASVRQAVLLLVGQWFASREAVAAQAQQEMPFAVSALLQPLRRYS